jgi:hypothetical protein
MSPALLGRVIVATEQSLIPAENLVPQTHGVDLGLFLWQGLFGSHSNKGRYNHDRQNQPNERNDVLALGVSGRGASQLDRRERAERSLYRVRLPHVLDEELSQLEVMLAWAIQVIGHVPEYPPLMLDFD